MQAYHVCMCSIPAEHFNCCMHHCVPECRLYVTTSCFYSVEGYNEDYDYFSVVEVNANVWTIHYEHPVVRQRSTSYVFMFIKLTLYFTSSSHQLHLFNIMHLCFLKFVLSNTKQRPIDNCMVFISHLYKILYHILIIIEGECITL